MLFQGMFDIMRRRVCRPRIQGGHPNTWYSWYFVHLIPSQMDNNHPVNRMSNSKNRAGRARCTRDSHGKHSRQQRGNIASKYHQNVGKKLNIQTSLYRINAIASGQYVPKDNPRDRNQSGVHQLLITSRPKLRKPPLLKINFKILIKN